MTTPYQTLRRVINGTLRARRERGTYALDGLRRALREATAQTRREMKKSRAGLNSCLQPPRERVP